MNAVTISRIEDVVATIGILALCYVLVGTALWLQFPQPKRQGIAEFAKGVTLLPILYIVGFLLRRGKIR